jgi:tRNA A-37 threonylcarbamoyl transferase component Bud32
VIDDDLQRIRASSGWRERRVEMLHGTGEGSVVVKGQRAARPAWRYRLLNGFAQLIGLQGLKAAPAHGGARAQAIEVERLRSLAAAGVAVPRLLHVDDEFFVQSWLGDARLDHLLQRDDALVWWQRGLSTLLDVHARGQYLSQAFARNFIAVGDTLAMIDFEDDPLEAMTLDEAQARDWLAYLHATALAFRQRPPSLHAECTALLREALARERAPVRALVADTARRLRWVRRLPAGDGRGWRRHIAILQLAVGLMLAADNSDNHPADDNQKVIHARHH